VGLAGPPPARRNGTGDPRRRRTDVAAAAQRGRRGGGKAGPGHAADLAGHGGGAARWQHARAVLAAWDQGPEPSDADWQWLAVEAAAAALGDKGADEALTLVWESMPGTDLDTRLAKVRAAGTRMPRNLCRP
jgi:hypothetical protein